MLKKLCLKKKTNTYSTEKRKQTKNVIKKKQIFETDEMKQKKKHKLPILTRTPPINRILQNKLTKKCI